MALATALAIALAVFLLGAFWVRGQWFSDRSAANAAPVRVAIPEGATLREVARRLEDAGVVRGRWRVLVLGKLSGSERAIKSGSYDLVPGGAPAAILHKLVAGEIVTVALTVPEGLTAARIAALVARDVEADSAMFATLVRTPRAEWCQQLELPPQAGLEGYLFPETYRFAPGAPAAEIVTAMLADFTAAFDSTLRARAHALGMSTHAVVTLASIVEAEAQLPAERARISAVYHNRLARGMRLQADPTVAYAVGVPGDSLTLRHLDVESAYNTYRHTGLPPGPICNPGRAALVAALWPEPGCTALYFVADGTGGHRFSATWSEHRRNVRAYRRLPRARERALDAAPQRP